MSEFENNYDVTEMMENVQAPEIGTQDDYAPEVPVEDSEDGSLLGMIVGSVVTIVVAAGTVYVIKKKDQIKTRLADAKMKRRLRKIDRARTRLLKLEGPKEDIQPVELTPEPVEEVQESDVENEAKAETPEK